MRPISYQQQSHPQIPFDSSCITCSLGKTRERHNREYPNRQQCAVGGAGPDNLSKIKLIIISDHPSHYEADIKTGYPMVDRREFQPERRNGLLTAMNAGAFLRLCLENMYNLDTYEEVYYTSVLKCNPGKDKPLLAKHLKPCVKSWFSNEMYTLDRFCPTIPIVVAGFLAFKGVMLYYQDQYIQSLGLNGCRRREGLLLGNHPAIFTFNPAGAARSTVKVEDKATKRNKKTVIYSNHWVFPLLSGSPQDRFIKDLHLISKHIRK